MVQGSEDAERVEPQDFTAGTGELEEVLTVHRNPFGTGKLRGRWHWLRAPD